MVLKTKACGSGRELDRRMEVVHVVAEEPLYLSLGRWVAIAPSQLGDLAVNALNLHIYK